MSEAEDEAEDEDEDGDLDIANDIDEDEVDDEDSAHRDTEEWAGFSNSTEQASGDDSGSEAPDLLNPMSPQSDVPPSPLLFSRTAWSC